MISLVDTFARWKSRYRVARERRWFRWTRDALFVLILLGAVGAWQTRGHLDGVEAPPLALRSLEGAPASSLAPPGKPVLLAFWAPWCSVCKMQSQNLSWVKRLVGDRAQVISVAAAYADVGEVRAYVREHGAEYPVLLGDDRVLRAYRVAAFPTIYFLDAQGRVRRSAVGYTTTLGMLWRLLL